MATVEIESHDRDVPVEVRIVSDTFVPGDVLGTADRRKLGVPLKTLRFGHGPLAWVIARFPSLAVAPVSSSWLRSYGALVSNSEFTRGWVKEWWDCDSDLLYPPVTMHQPAPTKEPIILNVGRFFAAEHGHSKKQYELVQVFRKLCDRGVEGWTLHLVGGCTGDGHGYFERVDPSLLPPGEAPTRQLLAVFELEKAVYELRYELNNRPDWVGIPVAGILRLLDGDD